MTSGVFSTSVVGAVVADSGWVGSLLTLGWAGLGEVASADASEVGSWPSILGVSFPPASALASLSAKSAGNSSKGWIFSTAPEAVPSVAELALETGLVGVTSAAAASWELNNIVPITTEHTPTAYFRML